MVTLRANDAAARAPGRTPAVTMVRPVCPVAVGVLKWCTIESGGIAFVSTMEANVRLESTHGRV
jgi:hypothetical protein